MRKKSLSLLLSTLLSCQTIACLPVNAENSKLKKEQLVEVSETVKNSNNKGINSKHIAFGVLGATAIVALPLCYALWPSGDKGLDDNIEVFYESVVMLYREHTDLVNDVIRKNAKDYTDETLARAFGLLKNAFESISKGDSFNARELKSALRSAGFCVERLTVSDCVRILRRVDVSEGTLCTVKEDMAKQACKFVSEAKADELQNGTTEKHFKEFLSYETPINTAEMSDAMKAFEEARSVKLAKLAGKLVESKNTVALKDAYKRVEEALRACKIYHEKKEKNRDELLSVGNKFYEAVEECRSALEGIKQENLYFYYEYDAKLGFAQQSAVKELLDDIRTCYDESVRLFEENTGAPIQDRYIEKVTAAIEQADFSHAEEIIAQFQECYDDSAKQFFEVMMPLRDLYREILVGDNSASVGPESMQLEDRWGHLANRRWNFERAKNNVIWELRRAKAKAEKPAVDSH